MNVTIIAEIRARMMKEILYWVRQDNYTIMYSSSLMLLCASHHLLLPVLSSPCNIHLLYLLMDPSSVPDPGTFDSLLHLQTILYIIGSRYCWFCTYIPCSGKFSRVQIFAIWLQSPKQKCLWVLIFAVQCQETTPTNSFACEIPVRGSLSQF